MDSRKKIILKTRFIMNINILLYYKTLSTTQIWSEYKIENI